VWRFQGNPSLKHQVEALGIPHTEVGEAFANGAQVDLRYHIQNGDHLGVISVLGTRGRENFPAAAIPPCFILDNHLGRLAAYLRMLGFDTLYRNDYQDEELAHIAALEERFLLTRDRRLLMRSKVTRGGYVYQDQPLRQLHEVSRRFKLAHWMLQPFHRCLLCNGLLQPVQKEEVATRLEPLTRLYYDEFHRCTGCGQVYWKGSHYEHMLDLVRKAQAGWEGEQS